MVVRRGPGRKTDPCPRAIASTPSEVSPIGVRAGTRNAFTWGTVSVFRERLGQRRGLTDLSVQPFTRIRSECFYFNDRPNGLIRRVFFCWAGRRVVPQQHLQIQV